jgi:uncharacterized repeat protein (TIGR03806 family)
MVGSGLVRPSAVAAVAVLFGCGGSGGSGGGQNTPPRPPTSLGSGLDQRPGNLNCVAPARAAGSSTVSVERVFPNLVFAEPTAMLQAPGDDSRWFVLERGGRIFVFDNDPGVTTAQVFLDIRDRVLQLDQSEAGLLGLAFHPNFTSNDRAYVNYTAAGPRSITSEFTSPDGGFTLDPGSERELLAVDKPADNHNGGQLAFDNDGLLRLGLGDGGGGNDPDGNAQNTMRLLGKMLRIDVDQQPGGAPYGIPTDNPFAGNQRCNADGTGAQACPEIFATGLRNPWRWSIDRPTGTQWVADVGQSAFEEIDVVELGGNYGWDIREGFECVMGGGQSCPVFDDPVANYDRSVGRSITGGYVYRGTQITELFGRYVFADFVTGMIGSLTPDGSGGYTITRHVQPGAAPPGAPAQLQISAFGQAGDGELYALDFFSGHIYRLVFTTGGGDDNVPQQLSASGCIDTGSPGAPPLDSLIPYRPNAPFWSDGADKERFIGLPNGQNISVSTDGDWEPPSGAVLVKHFRLGSRLVETRLFMRHPDGVWAGYTYQWNQAETDATRVTGGATVTIGNQDWIFPSEGECMQCHTQAAGFTLGLETAQLNGDLTYAQTGRTANQITTLNGIAVLSPQVGPNPPAYSDPADTSALLDERARADLHTNCANCHRPQGPTPAGIDLRHDTALADTGACDVMPTEGDLGIADVRVIAPGDDARSVLLARMSVRDAYAMPPLASKQVDTDGVALIGAWIDSLTASSCQ